MIREISEIAQALWGPSCTAMQFGSYAVGLSIFESDVDVSLQGLGLEARNSVISSTATTSKLRR